MFSMNRVFRNVFYLEKLWTERVIYKNLQTGCASVFTHNNNNLELDNGCDDIADYYSNKSVFITGGTGFLGKVLIEKLLYSCPNIDKIYVLTRMKNNMTAHQRFEEYFKTPLFERLRNERPQDLSKVIPIQGDVTHEDLGLSKEHKSKLLQDVSVVVNASAKIDFTDQLELSMTYNYEGPKTVINFCRQMKNLKVFVHISTAYCNCDKQVIEEKVYAPPADITDVHKYLKTYGNDKGHLSKILNGQPFTYSFAKALLENYLKENPIDNVNTFIIRPSTVIAKAEEPCAGWVDDWQGISLVTYGVTAGWIRFMHGNDKNIIDFIPVDYVANLITVVPTTTNKTFYIMEVSKTHQRWKVNQRRISIFTRYIVACHRKNQNKNIPLYKLSVYNCTSSSSNGVTIQATASIILAEAERQGFVELPFPMLITLNSKMVVDVLTYWQIVPAYVSDLLRKLRGKRPKYVKVFKLFNQTRNVMEFFVKNSWEIKSDNSRELYRTFSPAQQKRYPFDAAFIEWENYLPKYFNGLRRYLLRKK